MPIVHRMQFVDRRGVVILEGISLDRPDALCRDTFIATCEAFFPETVARAGTQMRIVTSMACRACGCTEDRPCEGGCSWIEPDLCSACKNSAPRREGRGAALKLARS